MFCQSCGAKIEDTTMMCPFCGAEVMENAHKEHNAQVDSLKREAEAIRKSTRKKDISKINRTMSKGAWIAIAGLAALFVMLAIIGLVNNKIKASSETRQLEKLEQLYQEGDYTRMAKELKKADRFNYRFEKYERLARMLDNWEWVQEYFDGGMFESIKAGYVSDISWSLCELFQILVDAARYREDGFALNEEAGVEYFEAKAKDCLRNRLLLTEEEIDQKVEQMLWEKDYMSENYIDYSDIVISRIQAN